LFAVRNISIALTIEGATAFGPSNVILIPASLAACAVLCPETAIAFSPCINSGKFLN